MCGIYGIISNKDIDTESAIKRLTKTIHRGPDNQGYWVDPKKKIFLGHNRLSIIDITDSSNQPMFNADSSKVVIFNGELYNYKLIRKELSQRGIIFSTSSDTEVVLEAINLWGVDAFSKFVGMFALCYYNKNSSTVILARDRTGEKPLYYSLENGVFQLSSEIGSIDIRDNSMDYTSLNYYLGSFGLPSGKSIYSKVRQLKPGRYLTFKIDQYIQNSDLHEKTYWSVNNLEKNYEYDDSKLLSEFDDLLTESIKGQLQSDVPLGVLLSGGIDSSIVTAKVSQIANSVNTFTVCFKKRDGYDESEVAKYVSKKFDTNHTQLEMSDVKPELIMEIIDTLDQPLADNSFIPVSMISKMISGRSIKVVLGGDGADEIFGGYRQYRTIQNILSMHTPFSKKVLKYFSVILRHYPSGLPKWNYVTEYDSILNYKHALLANSFNYSMRKTLINNPMLHSDYRQCIDSQYNRDNEYMDNTLKADFNTYLTNNILTKVDRASMRYSLEVRSPFLDKDLIEFGFTKVPPELKVDKYSNKILLQKYLRQMMPDYPSYNIKKGFVFPINKMMHLDRRWLTMFEDTIFGANRGLFNQNYLRKLWKNNYSGFDHSQRLYSIFVFNRWTQNNSIQY